MAIEIIEVYRSREGTESLDDPSAVLMYVVTGTDDDTAVRTNIEETAPAAYVGLPLDHYDFRPLGNELWEASVHYGATLEGGGALWSFDTSGGTAHINQSLATVSSYPVGAPNFQGAIGVSGDSVEGVDITIPKFDFGVRRSLPINTLSSSYLQNLYALTGTVNDALWTVEPWPSVTIPFQQGEALFLGASAGDRGKDEVEFDFRFSASPNQAGLSVGSISGIAKRGWEHLWTMYVDDEDEHQLIKRPVAAYVEQVYRYGNFLLLGIGT